MNLGRVFRTLRHLTPGQLGWRAVHELRFATYRRSGPLVARLWRADAHARFVGRRLSPSPFLVDRSVAERWGQGVVEYIAIEGRASDWSGEGLPRLWRYERHYHRELVALAALAVAEPAGPWARYTEELVDSWSAAAPPAVGDGWEPYPVSRRILNWAIAGCLEPRLGERLAPYLAMHARFLGRHLERHLLGNHLICNAAALVAASAVLEGEGLEAQGEEGIEILTREIGKQVLADGGYAERTVQYHSIVLSDLLIAIGLWRMRGRSVPSALCATAQDMIALLRAVERPDGSYPWVNDAAPTATLAASYVSSLAAAFGVSLELREERATDGEIILPDIGWHIVRASGGELLFDAGPIGPDEQPGHGHSDALSFELIWRGRPIVLDTGVTTYDVGEERAFERSARAHAVVTVGGEGPDELWGSFRVGARGAVGAATPERRGDLRILRGWLRAPQGWVHTRALVYWPNKVLIVADRVVGAPAGACVARVPLAPGVTLVGEQLRYGEAALRFRVLDGALASVEPGWVGAGFGRRCSRETITVGFASDGCARYAIDDGRVSVEQDDDRLYIDDGSTSIELELELP